MPEVEARKAFDLCVQRHISVSFLSTVSSSPQAIKLNFPLSAVAALPVLEFEARKDAAQLIGAIVRLDNSGDRPGERYVLENPQLLDLLFDGCARGLQHDLLSSCLCCVSNRLQMQHATRLHLSAKHRLHAQSSHPPLRRLRAH